MAKKILFIAIESNNHLKTKGFFLDYGREYNYPRTALLLASCVRAWGEPHNIDAELLFMDGAVRRHRALHGVNISADRAFVEIITTAINHLNPAMVAIVAPYSHVANAASHAAKIIRQAAPEIPIITGGPHYSFVAHQIIAEQNPVFDAIVIGPGEAKLKYIIKNFNSTEKRFQYPGICTKENPQAFSEDCLYNDCGEIPLLDMSLFKTQESGFSPAMIMGGRGCPNACQYCLEQKYWRKAPVSFADSIPAMRHEVIALQKSGIAIQGCMDSTMNVRHPSFRIFCEEVVACSKIPENFAVMMNIERIDKEACQFFSRAGGGAFMIGLETGSPEMLQKMHKKSYDIDYIKSQLSIAREAGITTLSFLLLGHPGETLKSLNQTIAFMKKLCSGDFLNLVEPFVFSPYPGLPYYYEPKKFGIFPRKGEWENWGNWDRHTAPPYNLENLSAEEIFAVWKKIKSFLAENKLLWGGRKENNIFYRKAS
jgi:radical SAM superfamily enzyme YgiQ (UPF0313 family)